MTRTYDEWARAQRRLPGNAELFKEKTLRSWSERLTVVLTAHCKMHTEHGIQWDPRTFWQVFAHILLHRGTLDPYGAENGGWLDRTSVRSCHEE